MTVQITDPADNGTFPDGQGWTATATIDSGDAVDGVLFDVDTNELYVSNGPHPDAPGSWTWIVPFTHNADIKTGHLLWINCYDSETFDPGDTHTDTASADGLTAEVVSVRKGKKKIPKARPVVDITDAGLSGTDVSVTVNLTPKTTGALFLALLNYNGDIKKTTHATYTFPLLPSSSETRPHKFRGAAAGKWTHIFVVAVISRHQGDPKVKMIRVPVKKRTAVRKPAKK